ncbi:MAG TPA: hypothetical protein VFP34_17925 [Microlunatus sp.]|nr:hypothetical protein [Microlunatus sp.]
MVTNRHPSTSSPASAVLTSGRPGVWLADSDRPSELSVQVSRALYRSAPVVVIAGTDDGTELAAAAAAAARIGVPLLLSDPTASSLPAYVAAEVTRLHPVTVLALGPHTLAAARGLPGISVTTDAATLPELTRPAQTMSRAVLTRTGSGVAGSPVAAALASTAAAATQTLPITVHSRDLRADPDTIRALAARHPEQTIAIGTGFGPAATLAARVAVAETGIQLPGGGQVWFPGHRLVALYGHPDTSTLGVLGEQGIQASITRAKAMAHRYQPLSSVPVVPTFEIIATTLQGSPGPDGDYSSPSSVESLRPWVIQAQRAGLYVVLDLQPGRANFLDQARRYAPLLRMPNVGLALDPEWRLGPGQVPLRQIGGVDAEEINSVARWLAELTATEKLPQKLLVLHQFRLSMIRHEAKLDTSHDQIQLLIHMDGQGTPQLKDGTWRAVVAAAPPGMPFGWKNFYDEDTPTLSPTQTMAKRPQPDMISYQ